MVFTALLPAGYGIWQQRKYAISLATEKVIGSANGDLAKKLVYDPQKDAYIFNKEQMPFDLPGSATSKEVADRVAAVRMLEAKSKQEQVAKVGGSSKDGQLYSSQFPKDFSGGASYYDNEAQLSFQLVPKFTAMEGDRVGNRLVYPLKELPGQAIYTVRDDGVKEDLVLQKYTTDVIRLEYTLALPKTLEARLLDSGHIGIYSADPSIYGSSVVAASTNLDAVIKGQEQAAKDHLAFVVPAPVITEADGSNDGVYSEFELHGTNLTVVAGGLHRASYPLSIDPTVVVANSSSITTGNNETNAILSTSDARRQTTSGGDLTTAWNSTTTFSDSRRYAATTTYNNYVYVVGGFNSVSGALPDVEYAALNSNGTTGTWASANNMPAAAMGATAVAYDGYLYALGGSAVAGSNPVSTVYTVPINSNGSLGTWTTTTAMPVSLRYHAAAAYKGYMYIWGGATTTNNNSAVATSYYAPINANGTLGSWTSGTSFTTARSLHSGVIYNGFIYAIGGINTSSVNQTSVQSAPINADGSVGTWSANTALATARRSAGVAVWGGYMYLTHGHNGAVTNTTTYAIIWANGTLGPWESSNTTGSVSRDSPTAVASQGYLYVMGGENSAGGTYYNTVESVKFMDAGDVVSLDDMTNAPSTSRERHASAVWGGYLYELGGYGGTGNSYDNFVQHIALDSNTGNSNGNDVIDQGFANNRADLAATAYNGYLYNFGGFSSDGTTDTYYSNVQYHAIDAATGNVTGAWTTTTALPSARGGIDATAYNGYMYVVGGRTSGGNLNEVRYSAIASNGSLGTWTNTTVLPSSMNRMRIAAYNGYLYVMGGATHALPAAGTGTTPPGSRATGTASTTVSYAPINSNGTIGSWTSTSSLNQSRAEFGATVYNGYLYAVGGASGTTVRTTVEYAKINNDGTVATWQFAQDLDGADYNKLSTSVEAYNGFLYCMGGRTDTAITNSVRTSTTNHGPINNGGSGSVGAWTTSGNSLPAGRSYATSVYLNGYVYNIGGNAVNSYVYATLSKDGSVGTWSSAQTFPVTLTGASAVTHRGKIYVVGGDTTSVYYAQPNSNGSISSWTSTTALPAAIKQAGAVALNGYIYLVGGAVSSTSQTTVYYAQIMPDGTVGTWLTNGNALPAARSLLSVVTLNGYIYAVGGYNGTTDQDTTYYAEINPDGSVGPWSTSVWQLPTALSGTVGVAANGSIYISGGGTSNLTYRASTIYDGAITDWQMSSNVTMPATKTYASGVYANGYIYSFGGNATTSVYYAPINIISRSAEYSKLVDIGTNTNIQNIMESSTDSEGVNLSYALAGGSTSVFGATSLLTPSLRSGKIDAWTSINSMSTAANGGGSVALNGYMYTIRLGATSTMYAKINADGTTGTWATTTALPAQRQFAGITTANGYIYLYGGANGGTVASDVYYAKPASNGTIASWSSATVLPSIDHQFVGFSANGYLYAVSGHDGSSYIATTYYAKLNTDGTIGAWSTTNAPSTAVRQGSGFYYNGYAYVLGGTTAANATVTTVSYAAVNANGTLGTWSTTTALPNATRMGSAVVADGYAYYMGGFTGSANTTHTAAVYSAPMNSNGTMGSWTALTKSLSVATASATAVYSSGYIFFMGGLITSSTDTSNVYSARVRPVIADTSNNTRFVKIYATIDDNQYNGSYPEVMFGALTGIYIDYRIVAPPSGRLYGGKFFNNNALQPLIQPGTNPEN